MLVFSKKPTKPPTKIIGCRQTTKDDKTQRKTLYHCNKMIFRTMVDNKRLWKTFKWCPPPESNRHSRRNGILNPARLPVPPEGRSVMGKVSRHQWSGSGATIWAKRPASRLDFAKTTRPQQKSDKPLPAAVI